jgi:DNA-binding NarL/FixJ family response regulator
VDEPGRGFQDELHREAHLDRARLVQALRGIGRGRSDSEIAEELHISLARVKTYVSRLLTELDARDRVQLVITAYEAGLVAS